MKIPWDQFRTARLLAVVLLVIGIQLQVVDTFVLNDSASILLVNQFGADASTPKGAVQRVMVDSGSRSAEWTPEPWFGRSLISLGVVLLSYGTLGRRWK